MLRVALGRGVSAAASHVGTIHSLDTPFAESLRPMQQAAAFQAVRRQQTPKMLAGAAGANGLDGTREVPAA